MIRYNKLFILGVLSIFILLGDIRVFGEELTIEQITKIQGLIEIEEIFETRIKLILLLIQDDEVKNNPKNELSHRRILQNELKNRSKLKKLFFANQFRIGLIHFQANNLDESFKVFSNILTVLPLSETKSRNLCLQYLSTLSKKSGNSVLEEKYLAQYVIGTARVSDFYDSVNGFKRLIQLSTTNLSQKGHQYFQTWYTVAQERGNKANQKSVLTGWVNFSVSSRQDYNEKPFELLVGFLTENKNINELIELQLLYAENSQNDKKRISLFIEVHKQNQILGRATDLGILTVLYNQYKSEKNIKKELKFLEILSNRKDYNKREDALKQLAAISFENEEWLISLKAHQRLLESNPFEDSDQGVIILNNIISLSQLLAKVQLSLRCLRKKALIPSKYVADKDKYKSFVLALEYYKRDKKYEEALQLYEEMIQVEFNSKPFSGKYQIYFHGGIIAEQAGAFSKAIDNYQSSLDSLLTHQKPDLERALNISQKISRLTEDHLPGEREFKALEQINRINKKRGNYKDIAKTDLLIAQKYKRRKKYNKALEYYDKSLGSYRRAGDTKMVNQLLTLLTNTEEGSSGKKLKRLLQLEANQEKEFQLRDLTITRLEIGNYFKSQEDVINAIKYYRKSFYTNEKVKSLEAIQGAYYAGILLSHLKRFNESNTLLSNALSLSALIEINPELHANLYQAYSKSLNQLGKIDMALAQIQKALDLKVKSLIFPLVTTQATILINGRYYNKAISALAQPLKEAKEFKDLIGFKILYIKALIGKSDNKVAFLEIEEALQLYDGDVNTFEQYEVLNLKSRTLCLLNDTISAVENQMKLIAVIEPSGEIEKLGDANLQLADYYLRLGRLADAYDANQQAEKQLKKENSDSYTRILINFGKITRQQGQLNQSLDYFKKAESLISNAVSKTTLAELSYQSGFTFLQVSNFGNALGNFKRSEGLYVELAKPNESRRARIGQANVFLNQGKMVKAEQIFLEILEESKGHFGIQGDIYNGLGFLYSEMGQYRKAIKNSELADQFYQKANQGSRIPEVLNARGLILLKMNDFDQAEITFLKAEKLNKDFNNPLLDSDITNNLGGLYKTKGEFKKARIQFIKTAETQTKLGFESLLALTYNNIGSVYLEEERFEESLDFLQQSRVYGVKYQLKKELAISWNTEGTIYFKQKKYKKAQEAYLKSLGLQRELELKIDIARSLGNLAITASNTKNVAKALEWVQEAVATLSIKKLDDQQFYPNPEKESVLAADLMKDFLNSKGAFLRKLAEKQTNKIEINKYLERSYHSYELSIELIEELRSQIKSKKSQQILLQMNIDIYQQLIAILYELGTRSPNKGYHEKAFYYAERSRARSFLDQLQEQIARTSLKIPKDIRDREQGFKLQISSIEKNIFNELSKPQKERNESKIKTWQLDKIAVQLHYKKLTEELEERFPAYAGLKYPVVYDLQTVRHDLLGEKDQVIVFFMGKDVSYGWQADKNNFKMVALPPAADIDHLVRKFRKTIVDPLIFPDEEDEDIIIDSTQTHLVTGLKIYRTLLSPLLKDVDKNITNLLIIPDGVLYYLPFETIVTQIHSKTDKTFLKGREYMIHRYSIYYSPSTSVLGMIRKQVKNRDPDEIKSRKDFIGFGDPQYTPTEKEQEDFVYNSALQQQGFYEMDRLFNTIVELKEISSIFSESNTVYMRDNALESIVKSKLNGYRLIHFATHGIMNENNPEFSGIILNLVKAQKPEDGFLQASEIFDLKLNSDLVVLSACETGLGKVIKGEGMVGLTRAFLFAGTSSIIVSLWTVADDSTSKLMIHFYRFLNKGYSRDEALRYAKLELMKENDEGELLYLDPFYWGPFILNGSND